jgi:hypothetical protein
LYHINIVIDLFFSPANSAESVHFIVVLQVGKPVNNPAFGVMLYRVEYNFSTSVHVGFFLSSLLGSNLSL